jgi:hypothetical protein
MSSTIKELLSFSTFLVLIVFLVMGIHAEEEQCIDVSGAWMSTEEIDASDCGGTTKTKSYIYRLIQTQVFRQAVHYIYPNVSPFHMGQ